MGLNLNTVHAKLDRSAKHFKTLHGEISTWIDGNFSSIVAQRNDKFTELELIYRCTKEPDIVSWSLTFGDGIHNLRSALDHLVYSIAVDEAGGATPEGERRLAFPILDDPDAFPAFRRRRLDSIKNAEVIAAIRAMQPDQRPHAEFLPLLHLLREFDDADKHRLLHLAVAEPVEWQFDNITGATPESGRIAFIPCGNNLGELKDGTQIARLVAEGPAPELNFDRFVLRIVAVVAHEQGPNGACASPIDYMIHQLGNEVEIAVAKLVAEVK